MRWWIGVALAAVAGLFALWIANRPSRHATRPHEERERAADGAASAEPRADVPDEEVAKEAPGRTRATGFVRDKKTSNGIAGARVFAYATSDLPDGVMRLELPEEPLTHTRSGESGAFTLALPASGDHVLFADAPGYAPGHSRGNTVLLGRAERRVLRIVALLKKETGTVTLFAFDRGQELSEHTVAHDALV